MMNITTLDPIEMVPKYFRIANDIRHKIEDQEWEPYAPIPSERQLEKLYNVSRTTIRQGIEVLIHQGYIYREHGRGTFIAPQKLQKHLSELTSFSEDMVKRGLTPGQIILNLAPVPPPQNIRKILSLGPEVTEVVHLERIRLGNNQPIGYQESFLVLPTGRTFTKDELEKEGSLYRLLVNKFNIIPTAAEETLEATVASIREAEILKTAEGAPLLLSSRILFSQNRLPVEFVKILYRGDKYQYTVHLTR
jgi:GntR family transcriptional regulator